jgi:HEAT repeat protein
LKKSISFVAAKAAFVIRDRSLGGFEDELMAAFERFMKDPVKTDPGCRAKLAALEALDHLDSLDSGPFLTAIRTTQREPAWGGPTDTAGGLRARGALGLARQGHVDFMLLMADLLADPEAQVREAAAIAIAHHGDPAGAGLLQLKAHVGDPEPAVILACLSGSLVPGCGVAKAAVILRGQDGDLHEVAALALGQSRREDALEELLSALSSEALPQRRSVLLRALGLHRSDRAVEALLRVIATGDEVDAKLAVDSLSVRSAEPGMVERIRAAAVRNPNFDLTAMIRGALLD